MCDIKDLSDHSFVKDRGMLVQAHTVEGIAVAIHAAPYEINGQRPAIRRSAPSLGQDNDKWLGAREAA